MARNSQQPQLRQAKLSTEEKRRAIQKIDRRMADIDAFDVDSVNERSDPRIDALETKLEKLLSDVFGIDTNEYTNYRLSIARFTRGPVNLMYETPINEIRDSIRRSLHSSRHQLEAIKAGFLEDIEDSEDVSEPDIGAKKTDKMWRGIHHKIYERCYGLYEAGHYGEAVEKSFKVVRDRLRDLTGFEKGSEAFGKSGIFIEGAAAAHVEKDFNEGVKFLTMAIDMFRNEKSHTSDAKIDDPNRASHYLALSSLAMYLLDGAKIRR